MHRQEGGLKDLTLTIKCAETGGRIYVFIVEEVVSGDKLFKLSFIQAHFGISILFHFAVEFS